MKTKKVALALSSGGARGLAHIGAIEALLNHGYTITSIAGTSMGSLIGAVYANGNLPGFREFMTNLSRLDVLRLMDLAVSKRGIIKGERVFNEIKHFIGDGTIEDLPIPFSAIATDLFNHREVIFSHGSLLTALRASAAIPTVLLPVQKEKLFLVDGGLVNPLPINRVSRYDGDLLVAINVNAPRQTQKAVKKTAISSSYDKLREFVNTKWNGSLHNKQVQTEANHGFFDIISGSFEMMQHKLTEASLCQQHADLLVNLPVNLADMFEFYKAAELIQAGYKATEMVLKSKPADSENPSGIVDELYI